MIWQAIWLFGIANDLDTLGQYWYELLKDVGLNFLTRADAFSRGEVADYWTHVSLYYLSGLVAIIVITVVLALFMAMSVALVLFFAGAEPRSIRKLFYILIVADGLVIDMKRC